MPVREYTPEHIQRTHWLQMSHIKKAVGYVDLYCMRSCFKTCILLYENVLFRLLHKATNKIFWSSSTKYPEHRKNVVCSNTIPIPRENMYWQQLPGAGPHGDIVVVYCVLAWYEYGAGVDKIHVGRSGNGELLANSHDGGRLYFSEIVAALVLISP